LVISDESALGEREVGNLRAAIEHRATWLYFLLDEARKNGLDGDGFARKAIFRCGCYHGTTRFGDVANLREFAEAMINDVTRGVFAAETRELSDELFVFEFHYCPLVAAWRKLTDNGEEIKKLCDIAMDGDRGIVSTLDSCEIEIKQTIAEGAETCRLEIKKVG